MSSFVRRFAGAQATARTRRALVRESPHARRRRTAVMTSGCATTRPVY